MLGAEADTKNVQILILDEEPCLLRATSRMLGEAGYQVVEADTGQEGLRLARETYPDLILLGVVLPDMDGLQICRAIKVDPELADTPVVFMSGRKIDSDSQAEGLEAGANGYIVRPIPDRELLARVEAMLRIQRLERMRLAQMHELEERVKELNCLYGISELVGQAGTSLTEILQRTVELLPPSWRYPEIACARIILEGQEFRTKGFRDSAWKQVSDIWVHDERAGMVEVCYLEERPEGDEGPFLAEERSLLNAVAERLGRVVERIKAEEALRESEARLELAVAGSNGGLWHIALDPDDRSQTLPDEIYLSPKLKGFLGYEDEELPNSIAVWESHVLPDDLPRLRESSRDCREGQVDRHELEYRIRHKNGSIRWLRTSGRVKRDEDGRPVSFAGIDWDITAHKQAEEAMRYQATLLRSVSDAVITTDLDFTIQGWNSGAEALYGWRAEEAIGRSMGQLVPTDYLTERREDVLAQFQAEGVWQGAAIQRHKDGRDLYVLASVTLVRDDAGYPVCVLAVNRDITERMRAERALRRERDLVSRIMDTSPVGITLFDRQGRITFANRRMIDMAAMAGEAAPIGRAYNDPAWRIMTEDGEPVSDEEYPFVRVMNTGQRVYDARHAIDLPGGSQMFISSSAAPLFDESGKISGVVTTTDDITAHVHAQEKLRESEEKYRDLVEKISDVIYAVDTEGVIAYVSPAIESLIGLSPEQAVGQKFAQFTVPEDFGRLEDRFQRLMSGVSSGPGEYRVPTQSGDMRWMRVSGQPIMDGGQVTGVQGVLTDITERKRVEEQREEAAAAAERARLARDLHDAVTQTLFSVAAIAEALPRVWERDPEEARRGLEELRWMARGALAEMRTMLLELRPSALIEQDLGTLVAQLAEATMGRTRMCVTSEIEGTCELPTDVQLGLYRIAQEALNNVARHARSSQVQVLLTCQPGRVQLAVRDDGQGFDPEAVGAHQMGVAIMRERAQAIGAEFSLRAAPGKGTEITVAWKGMATGTDD